MINWTFILDFFIIFFVSILVHEIAHGITYSRITGEKAKYEFKFYPFKIELKSKDNFQNLTTEQYRAVLFIGIGTGLFILLVLSDMILGIRMEMIILMILLYAYGCRNDIKEIITTYK